MQKVVEFSSLRSSGLPLYTGIDIFRILTEDTHIHLLGMLYRAYDALEIPDRTLTHIQIECLAQCNVQRTNTASHRCHQRTFNADKIFLKRIERGLRQPFTRLLVCLTSGKHLHPFYLALTAIGFLYCRINDVLHYWGNLRTHSITFDKRNCRMIGNVQLAIFCYLHCALIDFLY